MTIFKSTNKYKLLSMLGIVNGSILTVFSILALLVGDQSGFVFFFIPGALILYLLLIVFPDEVVVDQNGVLFRSKLRSTVVSYDEIKAVKPHYTTRTLVMSGGDKDKAAMFYQIKLKNKPLNLLMFGGGISNYRDLYRHLEEKIR